MFEFIIVLLCKKSLFLIYVSNMGSFFIGTLHLDGISFALDLFLVLKLSPGHYKGLNSRIRFLIFNFFSLYVA